jgi:putative cardiolipin synthase
MKGSQWSHTCLAGCHSGPIDYPRTYSQVITETEDTRLGREVAAWQQSHPGVSGFYPVVQGTDGLGARLALIDRAERTIDAQYFLIKSDTMGFIPVSVDFVRFRQ